MISWIASYPKSGSTWLRFMLAAYFNGGHININAVPWGTGDNWKYIYQTVSPVPVDQLTREDIVMLRPAALMHLINSMAQKPMLVKTHHVSGQLNDIHLIPSALTKCAIYVVRDPRDVAISFAYHMSTSIDEIIDSMADDQYHIVKEHSLFHQLCAWSTHVSSWLADNKPYPVHVVRYEDMLDNPAKVLRFVLRVLDIDVDYQQVDRAVDACRFDKLQAQEKEESFNEAPRDDMQFFRVGRSTWLDVLTHHQVHAIENSHHRQMIRLGYDTVSL